MAEITIGEFSSRSRLSVRMLRHYHEHGVLVPADVDEFTGYRRYSLDQLEDAAAVRRLRDIGFPVSAIASVLAARGTPAFRQALELRRAECEAELHAAQDRLALVNRLLHEGATMDAISVTKTTVPAMRVVALRGTVPTYSDEGELWGQMMPEVARQGIQPIGPCGCIEQDVEYKDRDVDLTIWLPVAPGKTVGAPLEAMDLPEREVVLARVQGPYSLIREAHEQIGAYLQTHDLTPAATSPEAPIEAKVFNRYLADPSQVPEDQLLTEVCYPIV